VRVCILELAFSGSSSEIETFFQLDLFFRFPLHRAAAAAITFKFNSKLPIQRPLSREANEANEFTRNLHKSQEASGGKQET
jgi:hypothetical protein